VHLPSMTMQTMKPIQRDIYQMMITYPTKSDRQIALDLNLSNSTVSKYRKKLIVGINYEMARNVSGKFLQHFQMASDYFMQQIENIEQLKKKKNNIVTTDDEGNKKMMTIPLNPLELAALERQQTDLWSKIIYLCRQSEAIEIINLIQNGDITALTN